MSKQQQDDNPDLADTLTTGWDVAEGGDLSFTMSANLIEEELDEEVAPVHEKKRTEKSEKYQDIADPTQRYFTEIGFSPLLTQEEEVHYAQLVQRGDLLARNKMIESNLRLVVKIARSYRSQKLSFLDIVAEGNLGLIRAVEKFDPARGFRFSTYAIWWIRQTIESGIMKQSRTIRLPANAMRELNSLLTLSKKLMKTQERTPSYQEIAASSKKSLREVEQVLELNEHVYSLDSSPQDNNSNPANSLMNTLANSHESDPLTLLATERINERLEISMQALTTIQREVLCRRFGLEGYERETLEKVGEAMGLARERIRQIQLNALKALRSSFNKLGITSDGL